MPARGNWGNKMLIITPILYKRVTCATCSNYCHEDCSCLVSPIIPRISGYDFWKRCKNFELVQEYHDKLHKKQVVAVKGNGFFKRNNAKQEKLVKDGRDAQIQIEHTTTKACDRPKNFAEQFVYSIREMHSIELAEINMTSFLKSKRISCFVNNKEKIVVMTMPQGKMVHKNFHKMNREMFLADTWTKFVNELRNVLCVINNLPASNDYEKWVVIPVIPYKGESCGEIFYKSRGCELQGTKLVEMDAEGNLLFATGPIHEKYWTREKINDLEIFK